MSAQVDVIASQRPRLFGLAYRMLGSAAQAEDIVQEAFVRWYAQPRDAVLSEAAFLTRIVTNLSLDHLKSAGVQRRHYPGPWLPEPISSEPQSWSEAAMPDDREDPVEVDLEKLESISLAFMALLERLTPLERAVYLLHEVFDFSHAEAGAIVGRSAAACRQVHSRARKSLLGQRRPTGSPLRHRELLGAFLQACRQGDLESLTGLLADDVVAQSDGGGLATAARRPVHGAHAVARLYRGIWRRADPQLEVQVRLVNGWPALVLALGGQLRSVIQIHCDGERIDRISAVVNPHKLAPLAQSLGLSVADVVMHRPAAHARATPLP